MKSLPFWFFLVSAFFAIFGMVWGIRMSIMQDHSLASGHAHNNLVGFVTMALYGTYYRLVPAAAAKPLAVLHFWVALLGALTIGVGIALAVQGRTEIVAIISSLLVLAAMMIFAVTIWINRAGLTNA